MIRQGRVVGYLQAIVRRTPLGTAGLQPDIGWIPAFFVHPERRREGAGSRLLEAGLAFLREHGRREIHCNGYTPCYAFPGVDSEYKEAQAFLAARGFTHASEAAAMAMDLDDSTALDTMRERRAALLKEGFEVRLFQPQDTLPLLRFAGDHFPGWDAGIREQVLYGKPEIVVALRGGEPVGYAQWQNVHTDPPSGAAYRFGPFGVREEYRSQGVGAAIWGTLIEHIMANGGRYLWMGWAGGRNVSFYERAGCRVIRRYRLFRRPV